MDMRAVVRLLSVNRCLWCEQKGKGNEFSTSVDIIRCREVV